MTPSLTPGETHLLIDQEGFEFREYASSESPDINEGDVVVFDRATQEVRFGPSLEQRSPVTALELRGVANRKVKLIEVDYNIEAGDTCLIETNSGVIRVPAFCVEVPAPKYTRSQLLEMMQNDEKRISNTDKFYSLRRELSQKITDRLQGMDITEWQGHMERGVYFYSPGWYKSAEARIEEMVSMASYSITGMETGDLERILALLEQEGELEEPFIFKSGFRMDRFECPNCTEKIELGTNGKSLIVVANPCPHPDGLVTEWELNVPSGKIVVANDLREWFRAENDGHDINKRIGTHLQTLEYAKVGMAHGFVGNTCPGVYRKGDGNDQFVIGNYPEEVWTGEDYVENPEPNPWGESVAGICTDLWWYSIVDYDEFARRWDHYTADTNREEFLGGHYVDVVDVKPGVYKFRHPQGTNRDANVVEFATFEWVRDPDPVQDFIGEDLAQEWNATEVVLQSILSWPTLYRPERDPEQKFENYDDRLSWEEMTHEQRMVSLRGAAGQIMCTLGGGIEWHEKGFPRGSVSEEAQRLAAEFGEIPLFEERQNWYPISEGYNICLAAGVINPDNQYTAGNEPHYLSPSFVRLGLNIARNMILFGEDPRLNNSVWPPRYQISASRHRLGLAVRVYRGLREKYPEVEPQDQAFDKWILEGDGTLQEGCRVRFNHSQWRFRETTGAQPHKGYIAAEWAGPITTGRKEPLQEGRLVYWANWSRGNATFVGDNKKVVVTGCGIDGRSGELRDTSKYVTYLGPDPDQKNRVRVLYTGANGYTEELSLYKDCVSPLPTPEEYVKKFDFGPDHPPEKRWGPDPSFKKEGEFVEVDAREYKDLREGQISLSRYQSTSAEYGECWYGDGQSMAPAHFVARVVGPVMSTNSGPLLEIKIERGPGKGKRLGIKKDQRQFVRQFNDETEYRRLREEIEKAQQDRAADVVKYKANPDYTFREMSVMVKRETPKSINEDGELVTSNLTINLQFRGASNNGPITGYGYYHAEKLDRENKVFGDQIEDLEPVGWKLNKRSVWLVVRIGDQHYAKNFKLNAKTGSMGKKGAWKPVDADQAKRLAEKEFARR